MGTHDVRLTIRVREDDLPSAVLTTLHEGGHGLYDQGFMPTDRDSFLGEAPSMGLHESQSRLWENHIGRSRSFWHRWFPTIQAIFPEATAGLSGETFFQVVTAVRRGTNRVNSDEVSYHLHILLRYELERQLISGGLSVHDLPDAWNQNCRSLLGHTPKTDRDGVLQDSHWAVGMFGYFPSYTIGSLYAAQLAEAYQTAHGLTGDLDGSEFQHLLAWLHQQCASDRASDAGRGHHSQSHRQRAGFRRVLPAYCTDRSVISVDEIPCYDARFGLPEVYADLVTVAGFKPVVAAEKSPGGFDSLPLPFLALVRTLTTDAKPCEFIGNDTLFTESTSLPDFAVFASFCVGSCGCCVGFCTHDFVALSKCESSVCK